MLLKAENVKEACWQHDAQKSRKFWPIMNLGGKIFLLIIKLCSSPCVACLYGAKTFTVPYNIANYIYCLAF